MIFHLFTYLHGCRFKLVLEFIGACSKHLEFFLESLWQSSVITENIWQSTEIFGTFSETFVWSSDNFWRIFGSGRKSAIFRKSSKPSFISMPMYNKQNNTLLVEMEYLFSCSTLYVTHTLRSLVRYRVEHLKRYFISSCAHAHPVL